MQDIVSFYLKESPDSEGRWLEEILEWNNADWEFEHDFIQWLFPTTEESLFNTDAPILTPEHIYVWHADKLLQHNLRKSYERWLSFCGVDRLENGLTLTDFKQNVWARQNHNWWRITRVLKSLHVLGLEKEAAEFFEFLTNLRATGKVVIDDKTWGFWSNYGT
jgi:hypothetical protein